LSIVPPRSRAFQSFNEVATEGVPSLFALLNACSRSEEVVSVEERKEARQNDWIKDREDLFEADYGKIAKYIKKGTRTFDTCLGMTQ
jgi:hypothetical protein